MDEWNRLSRHLISANTVDSLKRRLGRCSDKVWRWWDGKGGGGGQHGCLTPLFSAMQEDVPCVRGIYAIERINPVGTLRA